MAIRRVAALAPLLIGAPVLVAIVRSVADLVSLGHPSFADVSGTSIDAQSLFLGGPLYQDPAAGYTAQAYPPVRSGWRPIRARRYALWTRWIPKHCIGESSSSPIRRWWRSPKAGRSK